MLDLRLKATEWESLIKPSSLWPWARQSLLLQWECFYNQRALFTIDEKINFILKKKKIHWWLWWYLAVKQNINLITKAKNVNSDEDVYPDQSVSPFSHNILCYKICIGHNMREWDYLISKDSDQTAHLPVSVPIWRTVLWTIKPMLSKHLWESLQVVA